MPIYLTKEVVRNNQNKDWKNENSLFNWCSHSYCVVGSFKKSPLPLNEFSIDLCLKALEAGCYDCICSLQINILIAWTLKIFHIYYGIFLLFFSSAPRDHGFDSAEAACMKSLEALDCEYLDLYLIHWPGVQKLKREDPKNSELRKGSWLALEKLYKAGYLF